MIRAAALSIFLVACADPEPASVSSSGDFGVTEFMDGIDAVVEGGLSEWNTASPGERRGAAGRIVFEEFGPGAVDPMSERERELATLALQQCVETNIRRSSFREAAVECIDELGLETM